MRAVQATHVGLKDQRKGLFAVWQEVFQLPRPNRWVLGGKWLGPRVGPRLGVFQGQGGDAHTECMSPAGDRRARTPPCLLWGSCPGMGTRAPWPRSASTMSCTWPALQASTRRWSRYCRLRWAGPRGWGQAVGEGRDGPVAWRSWLASMEWNSWQGAPTLLNPAE